MGNATWGEERGQKWAKFRPIRLARALVPSENFQINEDILFSLKIMLRHQRRSLCHPSQLLASSFSFQQGVVTIFHKPVRRRDVVLQDAFSVVSYSVDPRLCDGNHASHLYDKYVKLFSLHRL